MADVITFSSLRQQIAAGKLMPVYLLHGEEGYYIDALVKMFEEVLAPEERDFNQYILYGGETDADTVMDTCRRYPMMADRQMVILKEAQTGGATLLNKLAPYVAQPSSTTVLVICCRGQQAKGKEIMEALKKGGGVVYESKKLTERTVGPVILEFLKEKGLNIEPKALEMMRDYIGTDLSRLYNEVTKLTVTLSQGAMVTPAVIEANIGISKDFNNFELVAAVARRDAAKAMKIVHYFSKNPKANPFMVVATVLFNLFSNLLTVYYTPDKSDKSLMDALGFRSPYQLTDVKAAMQSYNAWQVIEIIGCIRRYDAMSKGVGSRRDPYELLEELIYRILSARGKVDL